MTHKAICFVEDIAVEYDSGYKAIGLTFQSNGEEFKFAMPYFLAEKIRKQIDDCLEDE